MGKMILVLVKLGKLMLLNNSHLKQKEIAKKLNVSTQAISLIRNKWDKSENLSSKRYRNCDRKKKIAPKLDR